MNKRDYKEFAEGECYHIYNRGNGKMDVFKDEQDYGVFRSRLLAALNCQGAPLAGQSESERVRITPFDAGTFSIIAWTPMPNHFHFLIRQNTEVPISKLFLKLLTSYSMYFNRKYKHAGHVFQDRFKAVHVENDAQLLHVSAYIHTNPLVAGLVRSLSDWPHGSYPEYMGASRGAVCDTNIVLEHFKDAKEYERFVSEATEDIRARKDMARDLMMDI